MFSVRQFKHFGRNTTGTVDRDVRNVRRRMFGAKIRLRPIQRFVSLFIELFCKSDEIKKNVHRFCRCTNNYMSTLTKETDDGCGDAPPCTGNTTPDKCQTRVKTFRTRTDSSRRKLNLFETIEFVFFFFYIYIERWCLKDEASYPRAIYLGCYKENTYDEYNRLLKFPHEGYPDNVPQKCSEECFKIGFLYSGTTNGISSDIG